MADATPYRSNSSITRQMWLHVVGSLSMTGSIKTTQKQWHQENPAGPDTQAQLNGRKWDKVTVPLLRPEDQTSPLQLPISHYLFST
ncbi:hypothetical protein An01g07340 [Aspergillus niger]|uniref:Uncharacterized protein n=2 Tax=Aspergillus niger TaxID=5061 RepID=A2Q9B9_ASPNC|nr:hypothetical protein An01g07340 [Aspergillus niger]CAK43853.1 hypothetical protein An01g07340 [Aspergillus niger]